MSTYDVNFATWFPRSILSVFYLMPSSQKDSEAQIRRVRKEGRALCPRVPISLPSLPHILFPAPEPPRGQEFPSDGLRYCFNIDLESIAILKYLLELF